jgi:hypothetical protein
MSRRFQAANRAQVDARDLYAALGARDRHRPTAEQLDAEIRRLHSTGLRPRDIADALRLPLPAVLEVLHTDSPTPRK